MVRGTVRGLGWMGVLWGLGCSGVSEVVATPTPVPVVVEEGKLDCNNPIPPTGDFDYEVGFARAGAENADAVAYDDALGRLTNRYCGTRLDCSGLLTHVKRGETGITGSRQCVMVVVLKKKVEAWLSETVSVVPLEEGLRREAKKLMDKILTQRTGGGLPRVVVGAVQEGGVAGGDRAVWLSARIEEALSKAGFRVMEAGPKGLESYDVLVTARADVRSEGRAEVFDVGVRARLQGGEAVQLDRVWCGFEAVRALGPKMPPGLGGRRVALSDPGLRLEVETGRGGRLCEGDRTQITLTVDKPMYVRVFDVYARSGGLAIFPNAVQTDALVRPGAPVPLGGPNGFDIFLTPESVEERFVVIAAEKESELGEWAGFQDQCRLDAATVGKLLDTERAGFGAKLRVAESGFRVVHEGCTVPAPSAEEKAGLLRKLSQVRLCRSAGL